MSKPQTLTTWIHVTNACNLRCPYCYLHKTPDQMELAHGRLSIDAIFLSAVKNDFKRAKTMMSEPLSSKQKRVLEEIEEWANNPKPTYQLKSIVGPSGVGKSRLLLIIKERLGNNRLVFSLDLSRTNQIAGKTPTAPVNTQWLNEFVEKARKECHGVRRFDRTVPLEAMLDTFVDDLCLRCPSFLPPVLLVDGFDDIGEEQRQAWEKILARFLGRSCIHIIVAMRYETPQEQGHVEAAQQSKPIVVNAQDFYGGYRGFTNTILRRSEDQLALGMEVQASN